VRDESDEELMKAYSQGDSRAFEKLFVRHKAKVYGFLRKRSSSVQQADEVFQNAFVKLHQARENYKSGEPFLPWFFTILRNTLFDEFRKAQGDFRKEEGLKNLLSLDSQASGASADLESLELALATLSEEQRNLLRRRYVEGVAFEELAREAGSSPAAMRQSLSRLTRKIRNLMKGGERDQD
jgi:RNA polymerase sigma factor (sigma-70 family)